MRPKRTLGLGREHKDITCAVRLPSSMYEQLCVVAKEENSSLSDIVRSAITDKLDSFADKQMERRLKEARIEAELRKLKEA